SCRAQEMDWTYLCCELLGAVERSQRFLRRRTRVCIRAERSWDVSQRQLAFPANFAKAPGRGTARIRSRRRSWTAGSANSHGPTRSSRGSRKPARSARLSAALRRLRHHLEATREQLDAAAQSRRPARQAARNPDGDRAQDLSRPQSRRRGKAVSAFT